MLLDRARLAVALRDSWRTFRLVAQTEPRLAVAIVALGVLGAAIPPAIAWAGQWIVDAIMRASDGDVSARSEVLVAVALELGLVLGVGAVKKGQGVSTALLHALLGQKVNEQILDKTLGLELIDFEDAAFYDRMQRARREASHRPLGHVLRIAGLLQDLASMLGLAALLIPLSGWAVLALIVAALPAFLAELRFGQEAFRIFSWRTPESRKQSYYEMVIARADHAKEVKLFGLGPLLLARYREIFQRFWREDRDRSLRQAFWGYTLGAMGTLVFYGVYAYVAWEAALQQITLAEMTLYLLVFRQGQATMTGLLENMGGVHHDFLYLRDLFAFLDHEPEAAPSAPGDVPLPTRGPKPGDGIRFEDVVFSYPGAKEPALNGINLHLPERHKLALVGENGAGKTTLVKLLTRLYRPTSGRITLDGLDLQGWDAQALRHRIGVIFQDFIHYQLTLGENVGVGDVDAIDDETRWRRAADKGMADEVEKTLPSGFHTQLGKWFDEGRELSGGQWQKVALARAFMREQADILILDEPTASLDAEAEAKIFARFRALTEDRSAVLISHRFSTVRMADTIAVIEGGAVVEHGSHADLVEAGGRYARLFALQAQGYR